MSNIELIDDSDILKTRFLEGEIVFKITIRTEDIAVHKSCGIVQTADLYTKRRNSHIYTPLLYMCDFPTHLAYLYGCLNREFKKPHSYIYVFWWRKINTKEWVEWFVCHPYIEN